MVMARLHIICGNCGCNDEFEYKVNEETKDEDESVSLYCRNCGTIHNLNDNAELKACADKANDHYLKHTKQ